MNPFCIPFAITNMGGAMLAMDVGFMGPNYSISTACATGNYCIMRCAHSPGADERVTMHIAARRLGRSADAGWQLGKGRLRHGVSRPGPWREQLLHQWIGIRRIGPQAQRCCTIFYASFSTAQRQHAGASKITTSTCTC